MGRGTLLIAIVTTTLVVAVVDLWTSAELVGSILFTLPLALCALHGSKQVLWNTAAAAIVLTILAQWWGLHRADPVDPLTSSINRGLLIASLLTLTNFIHLWLDRNEKVALAVNKVDAQRNALAAQSSRLEGMEERYKNLLETAPDAMVIVDGQGRIVLVNQRTEQLFGYRRDELLEQSVDLLVPKRFRDKHPGHRTAYTANPKPRGMGSGLELFGLRKDGTEFPIEISLSPLQTDQGTLVSSAIRDITERRITEAALKMSNRELEAFSYSVAHDLRAPLRGMNGFAQVLLSTYKDRLDSEGQDWLNEILLNATKMGGLIDALLALARVTRTELRPESVDLTQLAHAVASQLLASDPKRTVEFVIEDGLRAELDPQLARVVADNLLGNAWKFTSKASLPRIEVGTAELKGQRCFFVRDNGAGFDMEYANKLFAPFQRLHTVDEFAGTGVGLATVQRIIQRHGGQIWAEGSVGTGANFAFTVPSGSRRLV